MDSTEETRKPMWTATWWRRLCKYTDEFDTLEEAWRVMTRGEDQGELFAESITSPDGVVRAVYGRQMTEADFLPDVEEAAT